MAGYNGSGSFVRSHNWVTDKGNSVKVTASRMDTEDDGFATGLSNAICKDGQQTTTAAIPFAVGIKVSDGDTTTPAINFINDTNTGIYRPTADNMGLVLGGTRKWDWATATSSTSTSLVAAALVVSGGVTAATANFAALTTTATADIAAFTASAVSAIIPAGVVWPCAATATPAGWLPCDGASLLRSSYAALFAAIGTTYGAADGSHFNVPDLGGRSIAGLEASATRLTSGAGGVDGGTIGATGGAQTTTLSVNNLAPHSHTATVTDPGHLHAVGGSGSFGAGGTFANDCLGGSPRNTATASTGISVSISSTGTAAAFSLVQPTMVLKYIIKT